MNSLANHLKELYETCCHLPSFQLYKEDLLDLLVPVANRDKEAVAIREDLNGGIRVRASPNIYCCFVGSVSRCNQFPMCTFMILICDWLVYSFQGIKPSSMGYLY